MKSVNVAELKNRLSAYLQLVRKGEEIIVRDRDLPIARISPCQTETVSESDRRLIAAGAMKPPARGSVDWKKFWSMPGPDLGEQEARRAILEEREEER
jgi:antitoxin (DNA-binding transcriptional repressor) of toxin-antitoxin stability system